MPERPESVEDNSITSMLSTEVITTSSVTSRGPSVVERSHAWTADVTSDVISADVTTDADSGRYLLTDTYCPYELSCEVSSLYDKGFRRYGGVKFP